MAEKELQQLSETQRSRHIARFVEILDVTLTDVSARLLAPAPGAPAKNLFFSYDVVPKYFLNEETRRLAVSLRFNVLISVGEDDPHTEVFFMKCGYVIGYEFTAVGGPPKEQHDLLFMPFAKINGLYNIWPFFRELVHSTTMRMGIPPMTLPALKMQDDGTFNQQQGPSIPGSHVALPANASRPKRRALKRKKSAR